MNSSLITLAALGAFHGLNPGMGWLFAVGLGMQEGRRSAVWRALIPLTIGHCLAIAAAVAVVTIGGIALSPRLLRWPVGLLLVALSIRQCNRHLHPRWASMRVGLGGLTWWSFLMASSHGAGLMALPFFLSMTASAEGPACHRYMASARVNLGSAATLAHGAGYLAATALIAWIVVEYIGLGLLRKAWINLDLVWAAALFITGILTLIL
jgi:hypothetical protein